MWPSLGITILIVALGLFGHCIDLACAYPGNLRPRAQDPDRSAFEIGMRALLVGLAAASVLIMMLALVGIFSLGAVLGSAGIFAAAVWWRTSRSAATLRNGIATLRRSWSGWLTVAVVAAALAWMAPPFDAKLAAIDAPVYIGAAAHIAESGRLSGPDPVVAAMTREERESFFANRFPGDSTGPYARFPGGVPLIDPAAGTVGFYFYHLWSVWLAFGLSTLGSPGFLSLLSFFAAIGLAAFFLIGRQLANRGFALAATLMLVVSFPQTYFMRMPLSEVPAQAFFLAGLYAFAEAIRQPGTDRRNWQLLAAALWGAFCLTRADGVLFLFPALTFAFLACGELRRSLAQWLPLAVGVLFFATLAFLHQIAGGVYARALMGLPGIGPALGAVLEAVRGWGESIAVVWLVLAAVALHLGERGLRPRAHKIAMAITIAAFALVSMVWGARYLPRIDGSEVLRHLRWIAVYLPGWLLVGMAMGFAMLAIAIVRHPSQLRLTVALLPFLLVPLASFVIDPWVRPIQPWVVRRLIPMALPLLLMFGLLGWHLGLSAIGARIGWHLRHAYTVLAVGVAAYFLTASWFLWRQPLFQDVSAQIDRIAEQIPPGALVLVPDGEAGMHLQVALQYGERRASLLLPFTVAASDTQSAQRTRFLSRQVASAQPVIALVHATPPFPDGLIEHFALEFLFSAPIAFSIPLQADELEFPRGIGTVHAAYLAFRLRERGHLPIPSRVVIGRPAEDIPFIVRGFHGAEGDQAKAGAQFRWTSAEAELLLPAVSSVRVHVHRWRPEQAPALELAVLVDGQPVAYRQFAKDQHDVVEIPLPAPGGARPDYYRVMLRSNPFSMRKLGLGDDPRELGLAVFRVELNK